MNEFVLIVCAAYDVDILCDRLSHQMVENATGKFITKRKILVFGNTKLYHISSQQINTTVEWNVLYTQFQSICAQFA